MCLIKNINIYFIKKNKKSFYKCTEIIIFNLNMKLMIEFTK